MIGSVVSCLASPTTGCKTSGEQNKLATGKQSLAKEKLCEVHRTETSPENTTTRDLLRERNTNHVSAQSARHKPEIRDARQELSTKIPQNLNSCLQVHAQSLGWGTAEPLSHRPKKSNQKESSCLVPIPSGKILSCKAPKRGLALVSRNKGWRSWFCTVGYQNKHSEDDTSHQPWPKILKVALPISSRMMGRVASPQRCTISHLCKVRMGVKELTRPLATPARKIELRNFIPRERERATVVAWFMVVVWLKLGSKSKDLNCSHVNGRSVFAATLARAGMS